MSEVFDPYWKWLGISPAEQPPSHYRLLGVGLFEDDPTVLDAAAARQAARLKAHLSGPDAAAAQKLLDEVEAAKSCLRNPAQRAAYERDFRKQSSMRMSQTALPTANATLPGLPSPAIAPPAIPIPPAAALSSAELTGGLTLPTEAQAPVLVLEPPPASPEMLRRMAEAHRRARLGLIFLSIVTVLLLTGAAILWKSRLDQRPPHAAPPPVESGERVLKIRKPGKPATATPPKKQKADTAGESDAARPSTTSGIPAD